MLEIHPKDILFVEKYPGSRFYPDHCYAYLLASIGDEILLECEMPDRTTRLRMYDLNDIEYAERKFKRYSEYRLSGWYKAYSYTDLPLYWLRAIVASGTTWLGKPKNSKRTIIPPPKELLERRLKKKESFFEDELRDEPWDSVL